MDMLHSYLKKKKKCLKKKGLGVRITGGLRHSHDQRLIVTIGPRLGLSSTKPICSLPCGLSAFSWQRVIEFQEKVSQENQVLPVLPFMTWARKSHSSFLLQ